MQPRRADAGGESPAVRPPAYAWDWFSRNRLLWREAWSRLVASDGPAGARYAAAGLHRPEVVSQLRADYPTDPAVRRILHAIVGELVFLGRTDEPFERLDVRSPPRGMRWWWTAITGEALAGRPARPPAGRQLTIDDVHRGYGD